MIQVKLLRSGDSDLGFEIKGHAGSAEYGRDLVCAAVSSIVTYIINSLVEAADMGDDLEYKLESGYAYLKLNKLKSDSDNKGLLTAKVMLKGFRLNMEQLEKQYGKYIKIVYLEVSDDTF